MGRYLVNKQIPCCRASALQCTTDAVETRFDQKSGTQGTASVLRMFLAHFYVFCHVTVQAHCNNESVCFM